MASVPVICIEGWSESEIRAYVIADNKLALNAGWDQELLATELQELIELDFEVEYTGFETVEIDLLIEESGSPDDDLDADKVPALDPASPPISRIGDLWILGKHRLLCGDATHKSSFKRLLGDQKAQMVFVDPPYNVPIDGHVSGLGKTHHQEFPMASGEMSETEFTRFLGVSLALLAAHSIAGSIHYVCMDWRHTHEILTAARPVYTEQKNLCVWNKTNGGMGSFYRSKHELIFVFKNGDGPHINNFGLGDLGRYRTNVWDYPGANSFGQEREGSLGMHPTVKPVAMVADAMRDCSKRGGIVLDSFAGSGTILIAAEKTGRRACAIELDPRYVDCAVRRWEDYTGKEAVHADSGSTFTELKEIRCHA
jgi:DNA modification methylase